MAKIVRKQKKDQRQNFCHRLHVMNTRSHLRKFAFFSKYQGTLYWFLGETSESNLYGGVGWECTLSLLPDIRVEIAFLKLQSKFHVYTKNGNFIFWLQILHSKILISSKFPNNAGYKSQRRLLPQVSGTKCGQRYGLSSIKLTSSWRLRSCFCGQCRF